MRALVIILAKLATTNSYVYGRMRYHMKALSVVIQTQRVFQKVFSLSRKTGWKDSIANLTSSK